MVFVSLRLNLLMNYIMLTIVNNKTESKFLLLV